MSPERPPSRPARVRRALTLGEEIANSVTHGIGLALALAGMPLLLIAGAAHRDPWQLAAYGVFAATLVLLYAVSTLYHAVRPGRTKDLLRILDHISIYLLIAGTYTPFTLGVLRGAWGWTLFGLIWSLAVSGILFKGFLGFRFPKASVVFYLAMGWLVVIAIRPLSIAIDPTGLRWLIAGGVLYSAGIVFFAWDRLRYAHTIWHLFVLGGSVCHFCAVLWYSAARPT